jgi:peptide/nickel transport system substrate-binding protein
MGRLGRFGAAVTGALVLAATLAACGGSGNGSIGNGTNSSKGSGGNAAGNGGPVVLRYGVPGQFSSLDPRQAGPFDGVYLNLSYDRLITTSNDGKYLPGLATSWQLSSGTLDMTLRSGVKFQDGSTFDAAAVKANIDAFKKPTSNLSSQLAVVSSVQAVDATHVSMKLSGPGAQLLGVFSGNGGMMISPKALNDPNVKSHPVGTGPYMLKSVAQDKIVYTKWPGYWNAKKIQVDEMDLVKYLDTGAMLRAIQSGQLDAGVLDGSQVNDAKKAGLTVTVTQIATIYGILLNTSKSKFGNPLVRQALMHAIDRDGISKALFAGQAPPTCQPYPEGFWAYDPKLKDCAAGTYDVAKAKQLLKQAGLPNGFSFVLSTITVPAYQKLAQALQAEFKKVGINVTIKSATTLNPQRLSGDFEAIVGAYTTAQPDPAVFIHDYYTPGGIFNHGSFSVPNGKDLLNQANQSTDLSERSAPIKQILEAVVAAGPPLTPIGMRTSVLATKKGITGLGGNVLSQIDMTKVRVTR